MSPLSCVSTPLQAQRRHTVFHPCRDTACVRQLPCCAFRRNPHLRTANLMPRLHTLLFSTEDKACAGITARAVAAGEPHALGGGQALRLPPVHPPSGQGEFVPPGTPRPSGALLELRGPCPPLPAGELRPVRHEGLAPLDPRVRPSLLRSFGGQVRACRRPHDHDQTVRRFGLPPAQCGAGLASGGRA
jgi:hypothetical protein